MFTCDDKYEGVLGCMQALHSRVSFADRQRVVIEDRQCVLIHQLLAKLFWTWSFNVVTTIYFIIVWLWHAVGPAGNALQHGQAREGLHSGRHPRARGRKEGGVRGRARQEGHAAVLLRLCKGRGRRATGHQRAVGALQVVEAHYHEAELCSRIIYGPRSAQGMLRPNSRQCVPALPLLRVVGGVLAPVWHAYWWDNKGTLISVMHAAALLNGLHTYIYQSGTCDVRRMPSADTGDGLSDRAALNLVACVCR